MKPRYGPNESQPADTKSRIGSSIKRFFSVFMVALLLGFAIFFYWRFVFTYSIGNRFGLLQKFSQKGVLFKTFEGELILSSVRSNLDVPIASEKFFFSVQDKQVAQELMNLQGRNVTVHYREKNGALPWRGDTRYIVDSVRVQE